MAEISIYIALERLRHQLERGLDRSTGEEVMKINMAIDDMKGFLNDADWRRERDADVEEWVGRARGLACLVEDVVDRYRIKKALTTRIFLFIVMLCSVVPFVFISSEYSLLLFLLPVIFKFVSSTEGFLARYSLRRCLKAISEEIRDVLHRMEGFDFELTVNEAPTRGDVTSPASLADRVVGMEHDVEQVKEWLLQQDVEERVAIFITGAMGTGKTTLAAKVYTEAKSRFDCHAWAFLSQPFQAKDAFKEILMGYESSSESALINVDDMDEEQLCNAISRYLTGKRYLLVLDDVRNVQTWNELKPVLPPEGGGKVLLTTRDSGIPTMVISEDASSCMRRPDGFTGGDLHAQSFRGRALRAHSFTDGNLRPHSFTSSALRTHSFAGGDLCARPFADGNRLVVSGIAGPSNLSTYEGTINQQGHVRIHNLTVLSDENSMELFCIRALSHTQHGRVCPPHLLSIAEEILSKCQNLPISIVTVGGLLSRKEATTEEWKKVLDQIDKHLLTISRKQDVFVSSGYADLSPALKQCFLYCAIFPENYKIPRKRLIRLWVAEGFAEEISGFTKEEIAGWQLDQLIERNMLQVARVDLRGEVESCRMLHLMRSFARHLSERDNFCTVGDPSAGQNWKDLRRFSTEDAATVLNSNNLHTAHKLRSLLFFGKRGNQPPFPVQCSAVVPDSNGIAKFTCLPFLWALFCPLMQSLPVRFRLLRVLELQGLRIRSLPIEVGELILLRYLGLRGTGVATLPKSLLNLIELETLDVRQTQVRVLPKLFCLRKLRHLYIESSFMDKVVILSRGVLWLRELQTLVGARLTDDLCEQLGYLSGLRKLSIGKAQGKYNKVLCKSISKMTALQSLSIKCDWGEQLNLEGLGHFRHIIKLKLGGRMDSLLNWVSSLHSLCYLYLWDSKLSVDPLSALKHLEKLVLLSLSNAYEGTHLSCDEGSFPSLKKLSLVHLRELESMNIMMNAMPVLENLVFNRCPKLEEPPQGIGYLNSLQVVQVAAMPPGFGVKMSCQENWFKVQHIRQFITS